MDREVREYHYHHVDVAVYFAGVYLSGGVFDFEQFVWAQNSAFAAERFFEGRLLG